MLRAVLFAIGTALVIVGIAAFAIDGITWRQDAWSEWRNSWEPSLTLEERHPWLLASTGVVILLYASSLTKSQT